MEPGVLVEALSRGLPADGIVADPDALGALSHVALQSAVPRTLDPRGIFNPGMG